MKHLSNFLNFSCLKLSRLSSRAYSSSLSSLTIKETLRLQPIASKVLVQGWVQSVRKHKDLYFVDLVDGTCLDRLQVVINAVEENSSPKYATSIKVQGSIVKSSHKGQVIELVADSWNTLGSCAENYPFAYHQKYSPEYIRQLPHLRPKTRRFSSILRIRNHASMAVHKFFQDEGFCYIHTPILTQNDCEGAGEVFSVNLLPKDTIKVRTNSKDENSITTKTVGSISENKTDMFFNAPTFLTVSGQFHLEAMAGALSRVYNFGPTFRAENSQTRCHASEFQMIEAEIAFVENIHELMKIVENCTKKLIESLRNNCSQEIDFVCQDIKNHDTYLNNLITKPFVRMSYKDAISLLQEKSDSLKVPIKEGEDLNSEHKQFLSKYCDSPVFVTMFPSTTKPFYMKYDQDGMAYCFDLFASYGSEVCGGSLREENEEILQKRFSFDNSNLSWYLDLRRYGSVPHGGFGIGFERLLQAILGISNIRDIIPFPRRKHDCKC